LIDEEEDNDYYQQEKQTDDQKQIRRNYIAVNESRLSDPPSPSVSPSSSIIEYHHLQRIIDSASSSDETVVNKNLNNVAAADLHGLNTRHHRRRLRILCLHGAASNSKILAFSLRHLEAKIKERASSLSSPPPSVEFVMLDSPMELSTKQVQLWGDPDILKMFGNDGNLKYFLWYKHQLYQRIKTTTTTTQTQREEGKEGEKESEKSKELKTRTRIINLPTKLWHRGSHLAGLEESLYHIAAFYHEKGSFDGILGFSQGGATAALLAALKPQWFKFVVSIAGFISPPINSLYKTINQHERVGECSLPPLLQVHGKLDETVTLSDGKQLCSKFGNSTFFVHNGSHHPPTRNQAEALEAITKFILAFVPTKTAEDASDIAANAAAAAAAAALM